jgi:uncharacterized protein YndB with AHSA1/START domain
LPGTLIAQASIVVDASIQEVWDALVDPQAIKQYMFGADVVSEWSEGSPITWSGEWQGRPYEDKGTILEFSPVSRLRYSHFSPLSGLPDVPENYHIVTIELDASGEWTRVDLSQDNNATPEEQEHSQQNWEAMLAGLKQVVEQPRAD